MADDPFRVAHIDELERIEVAGVLWRPLRRLLGTRAFGVGAFTADQPGDELIERHDETSVGAGRHEELYIVLTGRAEFTVAGETIDAPAGTLVFVPELSASRHAVASEPGTTVLVIGGPPRNAFPISPFEYWYTAEPAYRAGDYARAIEIVSEGLADWPDHPTIHYQLACYHSLAGDRAEAISHLRRAFDGDASLREWALEDTDLNPIRDDPEFPR